MLDRASRLTKKKEFDRVFKAGRGGYDKILGIKAAANDLQLNRFGIILSNKVSKKAVVRNKIRRQIRSVLQQIETELFPGHDIVIVVQPAVIGQSFEDIETTLMSLLRKMRLFINKTHPSAKISAAPHRDHHH